MDARESTRLTSSEPPRMMMMMGPNPNGVSLPNSSMVSPNSAGIMLNTRLPFNSAINSVSRPYESSSSPYNGDSSLGLTPCGYNTGEPMKKKRGRPRKYATDGNMALALSPLSSVGSPHTKTPTSEPTHKRSRGRPPGSGNKQQLNALGVAGISFVPHVITVKAGEDVASMIMAFSQQGPRTICILSANGAICNVTLRQAATSGGTVTYEGRFEIISLSGSFLLTESGGTRSRAGGLSVLLAGSDGRVLGGGVAGMLMAATPVQVIIGSFIAQGKKSKPDILKCDNLALPQPPQPPIVGLGPPVVTGSPPSEGTSTESSGDAGSPVNRSSGMFNGSGQPIQNMLTFSSIGWGTSHSINPHRHDTDMKMLPN